MNKIAINNGLFLGGVLVISSLALYMVSVETFLLYKSYILFLFVVILYVKTVSDVKKSQEGFISLGEAFKSIMIASAVGFAICTIFEYIQFNFLDPTLADQLKDFALEKMEEAGAFLGEDALDAMTDAIHEQEFNMTLFRSFTSYLVRMVFPAAVVGLIVAAIMKKDEPLIA